MQRSEDGFPKPPINEELDSLAQGFTPEGGDFFYLPYVGTHNPDKNMEQRFRSWIFNLEPDSKQSIYEIMAQTSLRSTDYGLPYFIRDASKPPLFLGLRMKLSSFLDKHFGIKPRYDKLPISKRFTSYPPDIP